MSLQGCPLLYVFLESSDVLVQRHLFEEILGLELIEIESHLPHHRHGVVKYDAGNLILSLNEATGGVFRQGFSDGLTMVFAVPAAWSMDRITRTGYMVSHGKGVFSDRHGHHYYFQADPANSAALGRPMLTELRLVVKNLGEAVWFYQHTLALELLDQTQHTARFATGSAMLALEDGPKAPDGKDPRPETYLIVFYTGDIEATFAALKQRGVPFKGGIANSEIGRTIRFQDGSGHHLCVYQPSTECLRWGSGAKVQEIAGLSLARQ